MKKNTASINKMIKSFDKELRNLLLTDLKLVHVAKESFVTKIKSLNNEQLMIA